MTEQRIDPDIVEMPVEDPDKEKTCQLLLPHPYSKTAPRMKCGRPAAYWVEVNNRPCGHKGAIYICEACWERHGSSPDYPIQHTGSPGFCGKSYYLQSAATAWRRL